MPVKMPCIEFQVKMPSKTVRFFKFFSKVTRKNGLVLAVFSWCTLRFSKKKVAKTGQNRPWLFGRGFKGGFLCQSKCPAQNVKWICLQKRGHCSRFSKVTRKNRLFFCYIFMLYFQIFKEKSCKNGPKKAILPWDYNMQMRFLTSLTVIFKNIPVQGIL